MESKTSTATENLHGFTITNNPVEVELVDVLGNDLTVVNSARISFGSKHQVVTSGDEKLIKYLAKNKHYSPFRHCMLQFRIKAPEFVMRQAWKHNIGCEWTEGSKAQYKDTAWNEISGRYKAYNELYCPPEWFTQHETSKQCSGGPHEEQEKVKMVYMQGIEANLKSYQELLQMGVSKEQARMLLPLTFMTEVVWTASLQAVQNFVSLRDSDHAQLEIKLMAQQIRKLTEEKFPIAFNALMDQNEQ